ncbi:MAG: tetratricopeptide repeat protein [Deltaproteobacteria bacterium]|nr:tetratricopeptide repeat protein [Deltaproteobacteria bacterium]
MQSIRPLLILLISLLLFPGCQGDEARRIFEKGLIMWEDEKYDEAIQNFVTLTKAFPEHHLVDDSLFWIANIYEHYLNNPEQTIRFYRSLTSKFENSEFQLRSMISLGRVRASQEEEGKRKAIRIFRKLQKHPEMVQNERMWVENQFRLIDLFFELKQFEQARIELKQVILKKTDAKSESKAYYLIGRSYLLESKTELAKIAFLEADKKFKFEKISLDLAISLADIYEQNGELQSAITVYNTILNRLERKEVYYQLANDRIKRLKIRLKKTKTG